MERHPPSEPGRRLRPRWRDPLGGAALHLLAGLAAALLLATPLVADLERQVGLQWLFDLRGARAAPDTVAVVAIDGQAAQRLGLPLKPGDWPRSLHARLVDILVRAKARVIVFDLTFATLAKLPEDDARLAAAIGRAGNVVLVDSMRRESVPGGTGGVIATDTRVVDRPVPPVPAIARAALAHAPFPLPKLGRVDAYWTFIATAGDLPTLPVVALQASARDELGILLRRSGADPGSVEPDAIPGAVADARDDKLVGTMLRLRDQLRGQPESSTRRLLEAGPNAAQEQAATLRKLVAVYAGDDARYLDFYGPARTIMTLSYADALDAASAATLAGRVVFVGFSGASAVEQDRVRDHYRTVFSRDDGVDLSGVEIAATAVANLLEDRAVRPLPLGLELALVALFGMTAGALAHLLPQRFAYATLLLAGAIYLLVANRLFAAQALWLPLIVPLGLQLPLAALAGTWQRYRLERRRHETIRRVFAKFLPPDMADQLVAEFGSAGAINRPIYGVCLGSDMEGYTTLAESLHPDELADRLNAYYARLFGPVERNSGFVSDIVGDAMIAIWGAPQNDPAIRRSACLAALEIAAQGGEAGSAAPALRTRIGVHAGEMQLVAVGASRHFEFRAVGDTINTASRIEGLSKYLGTRLLVSEEVVAGLDEFLVRPVGNYVLAGKTEPVRVFELAGIRQSAGEAALELCRHFADALQVYEAGNWQAAATLFAGILRQTPDDGPARFFAQRCARHAAEPRLHPWSAEVRMSEK